MHEASLADLLILNWPLELRRVLAQQDENFADSGLSLSKIFLKIANTTSNRKCCF